MTTVAEIAGWIEEVAPSRLAQDWDNIGLLWGDPAAPVGRVMTCLTVTPRTVAEAIHEQAQLVVSHHPVLFRAVKRIRADLPDTGYLWALARAGVAVISPHTAFDDARQGINDLICQRLGIIDAGPLRLEPDTAGSQGGSFKIVVFTPESDREAVMAAVFNAGAGVIGAYRECSFAIPGEGTFFGTDESDPAVGRRGRREMVAELRLEFVCPADRLSAVLLAIREAHSYEEPAVDVYPLHDPGGVSRARIQAGSGRIGQLEVPRSLRAFAADVRRGLAATCVQVVGDVDRTIQRVAVACGAGDDFLSLAAASGADVLVTGEARFHRALEAESLGIAIILAGHHASERIGVEDLAGRLAASFPGLVVWPSRNERDPFHLSVAEP